MMRYLLHFDSSGLRTPLTFHFWSSGTSRTPTLIFMSAKKPQLFLDQEFSWLDLLLCHSPEQGRFSHPGAAAVVHLSLALCQKQKQKKPGGINRNETDII